MSTTLPSPAIAGTCVVYRFGASGGHDAKPKLAKPTKHKTLAEILMPTRVKQLRKSHVP